MATTSVTYEASAGQTNFAVTFDYLRDSHLEVRLNDAVVTDWTVVGGSVILGGSLTVLEDDTVRIARMTPSDSLVGGFSNNSTLRAQEIQATALQLLYILQERVTADDDDLSLNDAGNGWDAELLPIERVGAPVEDTDAANKIFVEQQILSSGSFPIPTLSDIGQGLRVVNLGGANYGLTYRSVDGAFNVYRIPAASSGAIGYNLGYTLAKNNGPVPVSWAGTQVPLELVASYGTPEGGTLGLDGTDVIQLPRGSWEITVEGTCRNLTASLTDINQYSVAASIRSSNLATEYALLRVAQLGFAGGSSVAKQDSSTVVLRGYVDALAGPEEISVCINSSPGTGDETCVADYEFKVTVKEVLLS